MEKNPPLSKIYEALSAVADQRIDIQADRAYVLSSDHAKRYTVKFLDPDRWQEAGTTRIFRSR